MLQSRGSRGRGRLLQSRGSRGRGRLLQSRGLREGSCSEHQLPEALQVAAEQELQKGEGGQVSVKQELKKTAHVFQIRVRGTVAWWRSKGSSTQIRL
jgi:hypothetical protein